MAGLVFLIFFVLLALGYPIIMCMIGGAVTPLAMDAVGATSIAALIRGAFSGANSPNILCLPLFIFAGVLMAEGGISKKLFDVFAYFVGNKTGGALCRHYHLLVLRRDLQLWRCHCRCNRCHDYPTAH